jgi:hypothetical protein
MVDPTHTVVGPVIVATGIGFTVTTLVAVAEPQLLVTVYEIVAVPGIRPITTPPNTAAVSGALLLHTPPLVVPVSVIVENVHKDEGPVIDAVGRLLIVIVLVAVAVPQALVTA